jgi:hypothetical protein
MPELTLAGLVPIPMQLLLLCHVGHTMPPGMQPSQLLQDHLLVTLPGIKPGSTHRPLLLRLCTCNSYSLSDPPWLATVSTSVLFVVQLGNVH